MTPPHHCLNRFLLAAIALLLTLPTHAHAGMSFNPLTFNLKEAAAHRAEALSFFLVLTFALAALLKVLWNTIAQDVPRLPRLTYWRALGLTFLWGLFIAIIMSLTTGARALTTPGSWERSGPQYALTDPKHEFLQKRRARLESLKTALFAYAQSHQGKFPANSGQLTLPYEAWQSAHPSTAQLIYIPLRSATDPSLPNDAALLLYEPDIFDDDRFCLLTDGRILQLNNQDLIRKIFPTN